MELDLAAPLSIQNPKVLEQPKKLRDSKSKKVAATRTSARAVAPVGRPATYSEGLTDRDFLAEERAIEYAERRRTGGGRTTKPVKRFEPQDFPRASKRDRDDERVVAKKTLCLPCCHTRCRLPNDGGTCSRQQALRDWHGSAAASRDCHRRQSSDLVLHLGAPGPRRRVVAGRPLFVRTGSRSRAKANCTSMYVIRE